MLDNKGSFEESKWSEFENKIKQNFFCLMNELLQSCSISVFVYKIFLFVEAIQIAYYAIYPSYSFLWNSSATTNFQKALEYFQFNGLIVEGSSSLLIPLLYITFAIQLITTVVLLYLLLKLNKKQQKSTTFSLYCIKLLSLYAILLTTVGFLPFFNASISVIYCTDTNMNCYSGLFFVHFSIAILSLILLLAQTILYIQLFIDLNPCSHLPFAAPQNKINFIKLVIKAILPLYTSLDKNGSLGEPFVIGLMIFILILLVQRYLSCPMYNRSVESLIGILEVSIFWICVGSLISGVLSNAIVGMFYMFITLPFICVVYQMILVKRNNSYMTKQIKNFKKDLEIENYINILLNLIESRDQAYPSIQLEGVLKYHIKYCNKASDQCFCRTFSSMKEDDDEEGNLNAQTLNYGESNQKTKNWYLFLRSIIADAIDRFPKSAKLHLLHAYILQGKLQNKFKSLFALMFACECKPNFQEEFSIYRYKHIIEEEMVENDVRTQESKGIEVNSIVNFQNKFVIFLNSIEKSVMLHLEFWSKLLEDTPDIQKILSLGSKITNTVDQVTDLYNQLQEINQNHIKCLEIYGNFLKEIVHDDQEGTKVIEKAEYVSKSNQANKQFVDSDKIKYGENSNTCIITVSGNLNSVGTISNTNNETMRLLGFKKNEIIDQNVSRIMPKVVGDMHDKFMRRFFDTSQSNLIGHERFIFCLHKKGYLIPCTIMIKVLPNLDSGIQIVGFLKEVESHSQKGQYEHDEDIHYLIFREDSYQIQGISESCYTNFGIPASLMYGNTSNAPEFTIDSIIPGIVDPKNADELKSVHGVTLTIDTTYVQQNFLIEDEQDSLMDDEFQDQVQQKFNQKNSDDNAITTNPQQNQNDNQDYNQEQQEQEQKIQQITRRKIKYRQANIKVHLLDELDLGENLRIKIIKFTEQELNTDQLDQQLQSKQQVEDNNYSKKNIEQSKRTQNNYQGFHEESQNQDAGDDEGSNISGASVAEDLRHLKDFKQMISEKTEPKSILILKRTVLLLLIILMTLAIVTLVLKIQQQSDIQEGVNAINDSTIQISFIEQVNYYTRLLWLVGNSMLSQNQQFNSESQLRDDIDQNVQSLQDTVFSVVRDEIKMQNRQSSPSPDPVLDFTVLQQTGQTEIEQKTFSTAIFQFITGGSALKNSTLEDFIPQPLSSGSYVKSTQIYFYFVRENGIAIFRDSAFGQVTTYYNFYQDLIQKYSTTFLIIMIVALLILVITQVILIPIVFSVIKTNNKVLSLFGYIPLEEIKELANRCEQFIKDFLSLEANDGHNDEDESNHQNKRANNLGNQDDENETNNDNRNDEGSPTSKLRNQGEGAGIYELNGEDNLDNSQIENQAQNNMYAKKNQNASQVDQNSSVVNQFIDKSKTDRNKNPQPSSHKKQQEQHEKEAQELEEFESMRSAKLLNQTDNNKKYVIIKFSLLAVIFIIYFIVRFVLEQNYLSSINHLYNHQMIISLRPTYTEYVLLFAIEQIVMMKPISYKNETDLRAYYTSLVYDISKQISSSGQQSFPSAFSSYLNQYNATEYGDICSTNSSFNSQDCETIQNGILSKGLQTSIVSLIEGIRDYIVDFSSKLGSDSDKNLKTQIAYLNSDKLVSFQKSLQYMQPSMLSTNALMVNNFSSLLTQTQNIEIIILSIFITVTIIIFFLIWLPYLRSLSNKIWRTKGMLNMIPIDVITKHDSLKNAFISGDILRAVK
ncbi:PAS domain S-box protein (macronuclear) [Tetrahymena thermophila SB210]|uniref:PAS domain S-box protein n=1 Tax=Tetrahymena thermophila (strain SB210) TaxID=312017 RepID=I7LSZ1_TETTS|nr:PAS domain S-box protein [Tetrahymena thermophila SB210]EAR83936.2 PAS domain S-box protein [Tetrahymena thermophila SB210]|eukprot:XP_001031599.2 PAS domain S-box protein [Tetrahymena thermophila SB210]